MNNNVHTEMSKSLSKTTRYSASRNQGLFKYSPSRVRSWERRYFTTSVNTGVLVNSIHAKHPDYPWNWNVCLSSIRLNKNISLRITSRLPRLYISMYKNPLLMITEGIEFQRYSLIYLHWKFQIPFGYIFFYCLLSRFIVITILFLKTRISFTRMTCTVTKMLGPW